MSDVPIGWESTTLREIVDLRTGPFGSSLHQSDYVIGGGVPLVNPMHIEDGRIHPSQKHRVSEETAKRLSEFRLDGGDVVLGRRGEMGRCAVVRTDQAGWLCGTGSLIVRPRNGIAPEFLQGLLSSDTVVKHLTAESVGTTMVNLNQRILLDLDVLVPPHAEQARIVEKLEELLSDLDAGVAELKAAQRKLAQYRQSLLKAAVEGTLTADWRATHGTPQKTGTDLLQRILSERRARWEQKQLARFAEQGKIPPKDWQAKYPEPVAPDLTDLPSLPVGWTWATVDQCALDEDGITDGPFGSNLKSEHYTESGPRVIRLQNIGDGHFQDARAHISEERYEHLRKHAVTKDDVIVAMLGETLPRACVVPADVAPAIVKADCARIRLNSTLLLPELAMAALNAEPTRKRVNGLVKGIGRPRVNLGNVRSIALPVPPENEQGQILIDLSESLESCDHQNAAIEKAISLAAAQRKNLLKAAFAGQLVPQDPTDEPASALLARIRAAREQSPATRGRRRAGSNPAPATMSPTHPRRGRKAKEGA